MSVLTCCLDITVSSDGGWVSFNILPAHYTIMWVCLGMITCIIT